MHNCSVYTGFYDSFPKQLPSHNFDPWGKCTKYSPNAIKMSKMDLNDLLLNIILEININ